MNCSFCGDGITQSQPKYSFKGATLCLGCYDRANHCARCGVILHGGDGGVRCVPPNGEWYQLCSVCFGDGAMDQVLRFDGKGGEVPLDLDAAKREITAADINEGTDSFAVHMKHKFLMNRHKTHWRSYTYKQLLERLRQETCELQLAIEDGDRKAIVDEAADVGNFCMMIADNASRDARPCSQLVNGGSRDADVAKQDEVYSGQVLSERMAYDPEPSMQKLIKGLGWVCDCEEFRNHGGCVHTDELADSRPDDTERRNGEGG